MADETEKSVRLFSFRDDQATEKKGSLIPNLAVRAERERRTQTLHKRKKMFKNMLATASATAVLALMAVSGYGYYLQTQTTQVAAPIVTIIDPHTSHTISLEYGPQVALAQSNFFEETRDAFIEKALTFIEIDLNASMLRYFKDGVLIQSSEILQVGEEGSWWNAPSGLYKVEKKDEGGFSAVTHVNFPWTVTFEGNYTIHGYPQYPDKTPVPEAFTGGGIRLTDEAAKALFTHVEKNTPVLVHRKVTEPDKFIYEPVAPTISAPKYLIADLENGTILAASDLEEAMPIASLTKLMTAVVAAEKLNLDSRVQVTAPTFVASLIPRLQDRTSVSMYSLFQILLVESSNEAAEVIAGEYGRDEFITAMNQKATQLGMLSTAYQDPTGLNAGNVSSLGDLFRLSQYIHRNRNFIFEITAKGKLDSVAGMDEFANLVNFNEIATVDNFSGGKIGETTAARQTSISLHPIKIQGTERTIIIILLGSESRSSDIKTLLQFVADHFKS
jgi:hypothetical protein